MGLLAKSKVDSGDRWHVRNTIATATNGEFRPNLDLLNDAEQAEMVRIVESCSEHGFAFAKLGRTDRDRLEELVERSCGLADGHFGRSREDAKRTREQAERDASRRRRPFSRGDQTNLFRTLHDEVNARNILIDDVATICTIAALFAAGRPFEGTESTVHFEDVDGDVELQFNVLYGLAPGADDGGLLDGITGRAKYLAAEGWFTLRTSGPMWGLKLGPRLLDAIERGPVDDEEEVTP